VADSPPLDAVGGSAYPQRLSAADRAITAMYDTEYRSLVRMSAVLLGDVLAAEEVVQDSFIAVHAAWRRLRDIDKAVPYLRRSVLSRSRALLRHRVVAGRHRVAAAMNISRGAAHSLTARGQAALRTVLGLQR
jgi:hypothetical protein